MAEKTENKEKSEKTEKAEVKKVKAEFLETLYTDLGVLQKGKAFEIPEDRYSAWEKAGLCKKQEKKE